MRTLRRVLLLVLPLGTLAAGCAGVNRSGGVGGGTAVSGETSSRSGESGASTDSIATSGSNTPDPTNTH